VHTAKYECNATLCGQGSKEKGTENLQFALAGTLGLGIAEVTSQSGIQAPSFPDAATMLIKKPHIYREAQGKNV